MLGEGDSWANVIFGLSSIVTKSRLGADLFLRFCPAAVSAHVSAYMKKLAGDLLASDAQLTEETISELTQKMLKEAARLSVDKLVTSGNYDVDFMGCVLRLADSCAHERRAGPPPYRRDGEDCCCAEWALGPDGHGPRHQGHRPLACQAAGG